MERGSAPQAQGTQVRAVVGRQHRPVRRAKIENMAMPDAGEGAEKPGHSLGWW